MEKQKNSMLFPENQNLRQKNAIVFFKAGSLNSCLIYVSIMEIEKNVSKIFFLICVSELVMD